MQCSLELFSCELYKPYFTAATNVKQDTQDGITSSAVCATLTLAAVSTHGSTFHIERALQNVMYEMYPRVDEMKCDKSKLSNTLMGQSQSSSDSRKLLQADSNGPQLGFVSTLPCLSPSC